MSLKRLSGTVACIGTGPSLTLDQIDAARAKGFHLFGCNRTWEIVPDLSVLYGCNFNFWEHYWSAQLANHPAEKWTTNFAAAHMFDLHWIAERDAPGLSRAPEYIHHGHGSGFTLVNLAYLMGAERIILLGYDMKYAPDYDGQAHRVGSEPRHYFGEYPEAMQHWPRVHVKDGVHVRMCELYQAVADQGLVEILNATPGSALTCFPMCEI